MAGHGSVLWVGAYLAAMGWHEKPLGPAAVTQKARSVTDRVSPRKAGSVSSAAGAAQIIDGAAQGRADQPGIT